MEGKELKRRAYNSIDRSGCVYMGWTIVKFMYSKNRRSFYLCRCECGLERITDVNKIVGGRSNSCGCRNIQNHIKHNMSNSRVYNIWQNMKNRCLNPKSDKYKWYGGRGITVCERWKNSFAHFLEDMGAPPSKEHSIDRINNDGNYEPTNCRCATMKQQANNRRKPELPSNPD